MKRDNSYSIAALVFLAGCLLAASGCSSKSTKFYVLTALAKPETSLSRFPDGDLSIGIGPVVLPDYVNRPQIVTKSNVNQLVLNDHHHRAESLNYNVSRVLSNNFSTLLGTEHISNYPWNRYTRIDYQVAIDVTRFESVLGEEAILEARWVISTDRGKNELARKRSRITRAANGDQHGGDPYSALVFAESQALAELSREIADTIDDIYRQREG